MIFSELIIASNEGRTRVVGKYYFRDSKYSRLIQFAPFRGTLWFMKTWFKLKALTKTNCILDAR